jgi:hypothetical protein
MVTIDTDAGKFLLPIRAIKDIIAGLFSDKFESIK